MKRFRHSTFIFPCILMIAGCCLSGCDEYSHGDGYYQYPEYGNGIMDTVFLKPEAFDRIFVYGWADVTVTKADSFSLTLITDENMMEFIHPGSREGRLGFYAVSEAEFQPSKVTVLITMPELHRVDLDMHAELKAVGAFAYDGKFVAELKGYSEFKMDSLRCDSLEIDLRTGCDCVGTFDVNSATLVKANGGLVRLRGRTEYATVFARDDCLLDLQEYQTTNMLLDANGESFVQVWVTGLLDVSVRENAKVFYRGEPAEIRSEVQNNGILQPM